MNPLISPGWMDSRMLDTAHLFPLLRIAQYQDITSLLRKKGYWYNNSFSRMEGHKDTAPLLRTEACIDIIPLSMMKTSPGTTPLSRKEGYQDAIVLLPFEYRSMS